MTNDNGQTFRSVSAKTWMAKMGTAAVFPLPGVTSSLLAQKPRTQQERINQYWAVVVARMPGFRLVAEEAVYIMCIKDPKKAFKYDELRRDPRVKEDDQGFKSSSPSAKVNVARAQESCLYLIGPLADLKYLTYRYRS